MSDCAMKGGGAPAPSKIQIPRSRKSSLAEAEKYKQDVASNKTKLYWPAIECYRRRQTTTDAIEIH